MPTCKITTSLSPTSVSTIIRGLNAHISMAVGLPKALCAMYHIQGDLFDSELDESTPLIEIDLAVEFAERADELMLYIRDHIMHNMNGLDLPDTGLPPFIPNMIIKLMFGGGYHTMQRAYTLQTDPVVNTWVAVELADYGHSNCPVPAV